MQEQFLHSLAQPVHIELVKFLVCLQPLHHFWGALAGGPLLNWPSYGLRHHWQVQFDPCMSHVLIAGAAVLAVVFRPLGLGDFALLPHANTESW